MGTRELFVHIGASKTGTSSLQRGLWDSVDQLAEQGVGIPFVGRKDHVQHVLRPFGWVAGSGYVNPTKRKQLPDITKRLKKASGDRLLMSNEDLCELGPQRIDWFLEACAKAKCEVRVIISARDWAIQLPSEWQQFLKHRLTTPYLQFLDEVREDSSTAATHFRQRQDIAAMTHRWSREIGAGGVHVISVPSAKADPEAVFAEFASIVGYDPASLARSPSGANASFGVVEAEVYRRLNVALGDRLADYEGQYYPAIRIPLVTGALPRQASDRLTLPPEHLGWVREKAAADLATLRAEGYALHGDPERLVPSTDAAAPLPQIDEAAVGQATTETLARVMVRTFRRGRKAPRPSE